MRRLVITSGSLGCGNKIRFWLDPWVDLNPFASNFLASSIFPHWKKVLYCSCFPPFNWDFHFCRNLRDSELEEFITFSALIHEFQTSPSRSDSRVRSFSSNHFSVSSFSAINFTPLVSPFRSRSIRFSPVPSKIQAFLWKIAWIKAPTLDVT